VARRGVPLPLAILAGALAAGRGRVVLERLVIRRLYHRPLDSIVATWGVSLIATQGVLIFLGSTMQGVGTPLGSVTIGALSYSIYRLVLMATALALLARALPALLPHALRRDRARHDTRRRDGARARGGHGTHLRPDLRARCGVLAGSRAGSTRRR
jgi:branched-chain amino acid transport system permease protein